MIPPNHKLQDPFQGKAGHETLARHVTGVLAPERLAPEVPPWDARAEADAPEAEGQAALALFERVTIHNRRYLGSKTRLLSFLERLVASEIGPFETFIDLFAGTGVVGYHFNRRDVRIVSADLLLANVTPLRCFLTSRHEPDTLRPWLSALQTLPDEPDNYFVAAYADRFFSHAQAVRIGTMREQLQRWRQDGSLEPALEAGLLTSLLYAADRIAHTCGHYDAYRISAGPLPDRPLTLGVPEYDPALNEGNRVLHGDANQLIQQLQGDVLYLDPPYNSRQYSDTYHLLENLIDWQKPPVFGKARKMERAHLKSDYCSPLKAPRAFQALIDAAHCAHILVSYNNMGQKGDVRSNACISDTTLREILARRGTVTIHEQPFQHFTTGLRQIDDHTERVFHCRVTTLPR